MIKSIATTAALSATAFLSMPASAMPTTIVADGHRLRYESSYAEGFRVISGRNLDTGTEFVLREQGGKVEGHYGATPISYTVRQRKVATPAD